MHRSSNATPWPYLPVFLPDARGSMAQRRRNDSPQAKLRNGCADTRMRPQPSPAFRHMKNNVVRRMAMNEPVPDLP